MNRSGASTWQIILAVAAVLLIVGMIVSGQIMFAGVILLLVLMFGGGALLYRLKGPPER